MKQIAIYFQKLLTLVDDSREFLLLRILLPLLEIGGKSFEKSNFFDVNFALFVFQNYSEYWFDVVEVLNPQWHLFHYFFKEKVVVHFYLLFDL